MVVIAGAIFLGGGAVAVVLGVCASRLAAIVARFDVRAAPEFLVEHVTSCVSSACRTANSTTRPGAHISLAFPSATPGPLDVMTALQHGGVVIMGRISIKNVGGHSVPPRVRYRCFLGGEPAAEGRHHSMNPLPSGESLSVPFAMRLHLTTPAINPGDAILAVRVDGVGSHGPFLFWYDASLNEWRQDLVGLDPAILARVVI